MPSPKRLVSLLIRLNARSGSEFLKYPGENLDKKYSIAIRRKDEEAIKELKPIFEAAQKGI
jgi:hypothetical protein